MVLGLIVFAQLLGTSLWFSTNSIVAELSRVWGLTTTELGYLTSAVQFGFIAGTLILAFTGLADRFAASRIFTVAAIFGALSNAGFIFITDSLSQALLLRFATGLALAGIYPLGMKLIVSWAPDKAGQALGWLVGMLTFGTGLPYLIRGLGAQWHWQLVLIVTSCLAVFAAVIIYRIGDGPHLASRAPKGWGKVFTTFKLPGFRAAALGYFGHMWELYAFWTVTPLLIASLWVNAGPQTQAISSLLVFAVFAAGGLGCIFGGLLSARFGSLRIAAAALSLSGSICFIYPWLQGFQPILLFSILIIWGCAVVADSPQFSAMASKACPPEQLGSALAIMNSIGFFITIISIEVVTLLWHRWGSSIAWLLLPGPVLGLIGMRALFDQSKRSN